MEKLFLEERLNGTFDFQSGVSSRYRWCCVLKRHVEDVASYFSQKESNGEEVFGVWRLVFMVLLWLDDSLGFESRR